MAGNQDDSGIEQFEQLMETVLSEDQLQMVSMHQLFTDSVSAGFTEDQALSFIAKFLAEIAIRNREDED